MTRVVVCGLAGFAPVGGMALHYLQYCLGLRDLGVEVLYLEDNGWYPVPPGDTVDVDSAFVSAWLGELFGAFGIEWSYGDPEGVYSGLPYAEVRARCASADLLLNVSGGHEPVEHHRAARVLAYIDTDPGFIQVQVAQGDEWRRELLAAHDLLFTFAEAVNEEWCKLPHVGFTWKPTRQPVHLPLWAEVSEGPGEVYTTVMNWSGKPGFVIWDGETWGQKDAEFPLIRGLPRATGLPLEVALRAPQEIVEELRAEGWAVVHPYPVTRTIWDLRDYIARSRGEVTVVKQAFARSRSGWFPERSANYMAAGRPVVCQDTGWSASYGSGEGLLAFTTAEEAEEALRAVEADPARHGTAARRLVADHFDARSVLTRLLSDAGVD